jgi:RND family efflux transporter MFP subunit
VKFISIPSLVLLGLVTACGGSAPHTPPDLPAVAVSTARAQVSPLPSWFEAGGIVRARTTAVLASRIMAPVLEVRVRPGDRVGRGMPLVILDSREISANRTQAAAALESAVEGARAAEADERSADASLALARATHDRIKTLQAKRSATNQELDQAVAALDGAIAQAAAARGRAAAAVAASAAARGASDAAAVTASYSVLTSPFDGVVAARNVDPGSMALPGAPLLVLEDPVAFRLEVQLDEARAGQVAIGQAVDVDVDGGGRTGAPASWAASRVSEIARLDPGSHAFLVKVDVPDNASLRSGVFGRARFRTDSRSALTVPAAAAVRRGQLTFVFTVEGDSRARLQPISTGAQSDGRIEVLAGVHEGDLVVTNPPASLSDGTRITGGLQ